MMDRHEESTAHPLEIPIPETQAPEVAGMAHMTETSGSQQDDQSVHFDGHDKQKSQGKSPSKPAAPRKNAQATPTTRPKGESKRGNTIIESMGVYLPDKEVSSKDLLASAKHALLYPLEKLTGIKSRRMAGETEFSIDLARKAIASCMEFSKYRPADIDLLICCNISRYDGPDFDYSFEPSTANRIKAELGFSNALCFDISNACAGMFTAISVADSLLKAGLIRNAMVLSGEYITHLTKTALQEIESEHDDRLACLTLGDSGAAIILEEGPDDKHGFHDIDLYTLGQYSHFSVARPSQQKHGGAIMLTDTIRANAIMVRESVQNMVQTLKRMNWGKDAIHHVITHQTAKTAISEMARQVNQFFKDEVIDKVKLINNVEDRGDTTTTSHLVAIWDNVLNGRIRPDESVVFAIQASGITIGSAPYTFDDLPERLSAMVSSGKRPRKIKEMPPVPIRRLSAPRVRVEAVGLADENLPADSLQLAASAARNCLGASGYHIGKVDLLINAGVHRNDFISEPAMAAMLAGDLKPQDSKSKTLAYDIFNGPVGFLNACHNAVAMIKAQKHKRAMIVASEIENNTGILGTQQVDLKETGSAIILDENPHGQAGFGGFAFQSFPEFRDAYTSKVCQKDGQTYLDFKRDPNLERHYLDLIPGVINQLLRREGLTIGQFRCIFAPQLSTEFVSELSRRLFIPRDRFADISEDGKDYYTSSFPYALADAQKRGRCDEGDIGLVIAAGPGIEIGSAVYYF